MRDAFICFESYLPFLPFLLKSPKISNTFIVTLYCDDDGGHYYYVFNDDGDLFSSVDETTRRLKPESGARTAVTVRERASPVLKTW